MSSEWQTSTLGEVLSVLKNGVNCKQDKSGEGDKISRIESISDATFNVEKVGFSRLNEIEKSQYLLQNDDILFSHINSPIHVGKTATFKSFEPVYHGVNLLLMRPKNSLNSTYLEYFLKLLFQSGYWLKVCKQSVNQASVNQQDISKVQIRYPKSLSEQQRIVAIIDQAFEGIAKARANAEQNLQNARALFESHLQSVFTQRGEGWIQNKLAAFTITVATGPFGSLLHKSDYVSEGVPLVNPINIVNNSIIPNESKQINVATKARLQSYVLNEGDIVIGRRGEIGRCAVVSEKESGWICGTGCFFIRPLPTTNPYFLANLIRSGDYREKLEQASSGATMLNLSNKALCDLEIAMPPFEEQKHILQKLDALSKETQRLETLYQRKIALLDELKKSLLQQAFAGEL